MRCIPRFGRFCPRRSLACLALLAAALLNGCLEAKEDILGRYDAKTDEFVFLNVYQRIGCGKTAELEYLHTLWQNRDHLLTPPIPTIFGKTSYLRVDPGRFATLNLGERGSALHATDSPLPIGELTVRPGQFFLRGADGLCYYDQLVIPGSFADKFVAYANAETKQPMLEAINKERQRRGGGGKVVTWAAFRDSLKPALDAPPPAQPAAEEENQPELIKALSPESLDRMTKGLIDGTLKLTRDGASFALALPLAEADVSEFIATADAQRGVADAETAKAVRDNTFDWQKVLLAAVELKAVKPDLLGVTLDGARFLRGARGIFDPTRPLDDPDPEKAARFREAVQFMHEKQVPVDEQITVDQIVAGFDAGTLASHPSAHPVKPGEGLLEAPATPAAP